MAFKMKGSAFKLNNVATKSALKQQASPMKVAGGKYKYEMVKDEFGEEDQINTQISDQEYDAIIAQNQADSDAVAAGTKTLASIVPGVGLGAEGLDGTKYKSVGELKEALSTMNKASKEYRKLKDIYNWETSDEGKEETANQRRLNLNYQQPQ